jgi:polyhydroxyalkanoate synthesis regulator phasin
LVTEPPATKESVRLFFGKNSIRNFFIWSLARYSLHDRNVKLTHDKLASRKDKAVRFVRDVLDDPGRAEEIENESPEDYAMRRKIQIVNPTRGVKAMVRQTESREELRERIRELEEENETLQDQLDQVADIVSPMEEDE